MTKNRARKQAVRAAMAATGDAYTRTRRLTDPDAATPAGPFPLGRDAAGTPVLLSEDELALHALLLGAPDDGRQQLVRTIGAALLARGWSGTILDAADADDPDGLGAWCRDHAGQRQTPYQQLRTGAVAAGTDVARWCDPFTVADPGEVCDIVLPLDPMADEYWKTITRGVIGQAVNLLAWAHQVDPETFAAPTLRSLADLLAVADLPAATAAMRSTVDGRVPGGVDPDLRLLERPGVDHQKVAARFADTLTRLLGTPAGQVAFRPGDGGTPLDIAAPGLTYIGTGSTEPGVDQVVSATVLRQLVDHVMATAHAAGPVPGRRFVVVNAAHTVDGRVLQHLLARARAAGVAVIVCADGLEAWGSGAVGVDLPRLVQNVNVSVVTRQETPADAAWAVAHLGAGDLTDPATLRHLPDAAGFVRVAHPARVQALWPAPADRD